MSWSQRTARLLHVAPFPSHRALHPDPGPPGLDTQPGARPGCLPQGALATLICKSALIPLPQAYHSLPVLVPRPFLPQRLPTSSATPSPPPTFWACAAAELLFPSTSLFPVSSPWSLSLPHPRFPPQASRCPAVFLTRQPACIPA